MFNKLLEAVSVAIGNEFALGYAVYMEEVKQGVEKPCFFIRTINNRTIPMLSGVKLNGCTLVVQFFPDGTNKNRDMNDVSNRLEECLKYLKVGGRVLHGKKLHDDRKGGVGISGLDIQYEPIDGVLSYYVDYIFRCEDEIIDEGNGVMEKLLFEGGI